MYQEDLSQLVTVCGDWAPGFPLGYRQLGSGGVDRSENRVPPQFLPQWYFSGLSPWRDPRAAPALPQFTARGFGC